MVRRRVMRPAMLGGRSFLSKLYRKVLKPVGKAIGKSGVVGDVVGAFNPTAGKLVKKVGLGRRRRVGRPRGSTTKRRRQAGGSLISAIKKGLSAANKEAKKRQLVSKGLSSLGYKKAASLAGQAGYGRVIMF